MYKSLQKWGSREFVAELIGTIIFVFIAKATGFALWPLAGTQQAAHLQGALGAGLGLMLGILVTAEVSGGHFNPTISIAWCVCGRMPWRKLPAYLIAQFLGSALAVLLVLVVYWELAEKAGPSLGLGLASFPGLSTPPYWGSLVADQVVASTLLLLAFSSIVERKLQPGPLLMALSVTGIILSLGMNAGCAMNPSMDFCARALAAAWSGSSVPFSTSSPYWLIPLILPPLGGTLGVGLHWVVNRHLPKLE